VLVDPLRPGHETTHHPGEAVLRMADVIVVAKSDAALPADVRRVTDTARGHQPARGAHARRLAGAPRRRRRCAAAACWWWRTGRR
jgi:predicted GTPase